MRVRLREFLSAVMGEHVGSYLSSRKEFLRKHGITKEQLLRMRKACEKGNFRIRGGYHDEER